MKIRGGRKSLFLCSTILRGRVTKDDNAGGAIEVGPGFAAASDAMSGDDNRPKPGAGENAQPVDKGGEADAGAGSDDGDNGGADDGDAGGADDGEGGDDGEEGVKPAKKPRDTAAYIRELKRTAREEKAARVALEARMAVLEKGGLPNNQAGDKPDPTSEKPDANDATKYPLGVLDDGYIHDMIDWQTDQKVQKALDGRAQTEKREAEEARQAEHLTTLRSKVDDMTAAGSTLYDDYEETVLESGMRGDWKLTETTFTTATEAKHGAEILYALAQDPTEAERVSKLSMIQQVKYVLEKDAELASKPKPRVKPAAGDPPQDIPRGRNSSSALRPDTDNLNDFRKQFYQKN